MILLRHRQENGTLWLRDGRVADAEIDGGSRGREAVYEMALWDEGTFEADFSPVAVTERIFEPTSALLLEAMRRRDEAQRDAAPPHAAIPDPPPQPPRPLLAVHRALTLLNVAASYASEMLEPALLARRFEQVRRELASEHPVLASFRESDHGAVSADGEASRSGAEAVVRATALWLRQLFALLEQALPGRFPLRRLRQITEAVQDDLESLGFSFEFEFGFRHGRQNVRIGLVRSPLGNEVIVTVNRVRKLDLPALARAHARSHPRAPGRRGGPAGRGRQ